MTTVISFASSGLSMLPYLQQVEIDSVVVCMLPPLPYRIPANFSLPADEDAEKGLNLDTYLVRNKAATHFFREAGDFMAICAKFSRIADMANGRRSAMLPHWRQVSRADAKVSFVDPVD